MGIMLLKRQNMVGEMDKGRNVRDRKRIGTKSFRVSFSVLLYITYGEETGSVF